MTFRHSERNGRDSFMTFEGFYFLRRSGPRADLDGWMSKENTKFGGIIAKPSNFGNSNPWVLASAGNPFSTEPFLTRPPPVVRFFAGPLDTIR